MTTTTANNPTIITGNAITSRVAHVLDNFSSQKNLDKMHEIWGESPQQNFDDASIMEHCTNCGELFDKFWFHIVPLEMPVVFKCRLTSPFSFFLFLVMRRAKLSHHRVRLGQFNDDEMERISKALGELRAVKFKIYDARINNGELEFTGDKSLVLISL